MDVDIQTIIEGGAVGIAIVMIMYSAWKDQLYNKTLNNHLQHIDISLNRLSQALEKQNGNHESFIGVLDKNTRVVGRAQDVMDKMFDKFIK